jgi:hypothetical protein
MPRIGTPRASFHLLCDQPLAYRCKDVLLMNLSLARRLQFLSVGCMLPMVPISACLVSLQLAWLNAAPRAIPAPELTIFQRDAPSYPN